MLPMLIEDCLNVIVNRNESVDHIKIIIKSQIEAHQNIMNGYQEILEKVNDNINDQEYLIKYFKDIVKPWKEREEKEHEILAECYRNRFFMHQRSK